MLGWLSVDYVKDCFSFFDRFSKWQSIYVFLWKLEWRVVNLNYAAAAAAGLKWFALTLSFTNQNHFTEFPFSMLRRPGNRFLLQKNLRLLFTWFVFLRIRFFKSFKRSFHFLLIINAKIKDFLFWFPIQTLLMWKFRFMQHERTRIWKKRKKKKDKKIEKKKRLYL